MVRGRRRCQAPCPAELHRPSAVARALRGHPAAEDRAAPAPGGSRVQAPPEGIAELDPDAVWCLGAQHGVRNGRVGVHRPCADQAPGRRRPRRAGSGALRELRRDGHRGGRRACARRSRRRRRAAGRRRGLRGRLPPGRARRGLRLLGGLPARNRDGTQNALAACRAAGVRRFVHTGTEAALMDGKPLVNVDETAPLKPDSPAFYPRSKARAEQAVMAANDEAFETVALRPRFVWGPGTRRSCHRSSRWSRAASSLGSAAGVSRRTPPTSTTSSRASCSAAERGRPRRGLLRHRR